MKCNFCDNESEYDISLYDDKYCQHGDEPFFKLHESTPRICHNCMIENESQKTIDVHNNIIHCTYHLVKLNTSGILIYMKTGKN